MGRRDRIDPWDNLQMSWDTPPDRVRLRTDAQAAKMSWPFGDDLAEAMSTLDDAYFRVFLKKAWSLCEQEAKRRPAGERAGFLKEQEARLAGYRRARKQDR